MFSRMMLHLRRLGGWRAQPDPERKDHILTDLRLKKFNFAVPSPQGTLDIFRDHWASDVGQIIPGVEAGPTGLFDDPRVGFALKHFANRAGGLKGQRVLELGPLEAAHTYQLENLGADVVAVEANTEAYLKCLIVKELSGIARARFLYGDFLEYLRTDNTRFDFMFCCGVFYHMDNPLALIELMTARTDCIFLWTHYYIPNNHEAVASEAVEQDGQAYTYYRRQNLDRPSIVYWGGGGSTSALMSRDDILRAFKQQGFKYLDVHEDELQHPGGPCFSVSLWK